MDRQDPTTLAARLEALVEQGPDELLELDAAGIVLSGNGIARRRLGPDLAGRPLHELLDPSTPREVVTRLAEPPPEGCDREVVLRDGRRVLVRSVTHRGRPDGAVLALRDVSERAVMVDEVESGRRMAAVARLAGGIAHEINNPLTVLQLRTDLLLEETSVPAAIRQQLMVLRDSTARIARTVRTLQRISRPALTTAEWVSVAELVDGALRDARAWAGAARIEVDPVPLVGVRGDPAALGLALEQILAHACDPSGGTVQVSVVEGRVRIDVRTEQARWEEGTIHDPSASPTDARFPGIGLAVAAAVARDHGGELRTLRPEPRGGLIRLDLPLAPSTATGRTPRSRVLVVDDEPLVASVLADWARRAGHEVQVVSDAEQAMRLLSSAGPAFDVVLADDHLPGTSGRQLVGWIAETRPELAGRVALMSGAAIETGGARFLAKPFTRRQLAELMGELLQGGR